MYHKGVCLGSVVSNLKNNTKPERNDCPSITRKRGYIAMLSVEPEYRRLGLGRLLIKKSIDVMI